MNTKYTIRVVFSRIYFSSWQIIELDIKTFSLSAGFSKHGGGGEENPLFVKNGYPSNVMVNEEILS